MKTTRIIGIILSVILLLAVSTNAAEAKTMIFENCKASYETEEGDTFIYIKELSCPGQVARNTNGDYYFDTICSKIWKTCFYKGHNYGKMNTEVDRAFNAYNEGMNRIDGKLRIAITAHEASKGNIKYIKSLISGGLDFSYGDDVKKCSKPTKH